MQTERENLCLQSVCRESPYVERERRYPTERREKPERGERGGGVSRGADPVTRGEMLKTCPLIMTHLCSKQVLQEIFKMCGLMMTGLGDGGVRRG
jgi:hypothetical protein